MNETELILTSIFAFVIGYALAHFAKSIGRFFSDWGGFVSFLVFPVIVMFLISGAAMIAGMGSVFLSLAFALGFIVRMLRRGNFG